MAPAVLSDDAKLAQAETWTGICPDLRKIVFLDRSILIRDKDSRWEILSCGGRMLRVRLRV